MANASEMRAPTVAEMNSAVMSRLRAPFGCEYITGAVGGRSDRWRIRDANDDAVASCAAAEEGYARLIVEALNLHPLFRNQVGNKNQRPDATDDPPGPRPILDV